VIVVSDTSPLSALITIGRADLLVTLFGKVYMPPAVEFELRQFHASLPPFLILQCVAHPSRVTPLRQRLDQGEAEAIVLAQELQAGYLLMDEIAGRDVAQQAGLHVVGLLGVLIQAKQKALLPSIQAVLMDLEAGTTFYIGADLKARVLREAGEH